MQQLIPCLAILQFLRRDLRCLSRRVCCKSSVAVVAIAFVKLVAASGDFLHSSSLYVVCQLHFCCHYNRNRCNQQHRFQLLVGVVALLPGLFQNQFPLSSLWKLPLFTSKPIARRSFSPVRKLIFCCLCCFCRPADRCRPLEYQTLITSRYKTLILQLQPFSSRCKVSILLSPRKSSLRTHLWLLPMASKSMSVFVTETEF